MIYGYCIRRVSDRELAADLTSQIFTRALVAIPRYRPGITPGTFRSWLFAIAHNLIVDSYRTRHTIHSLDAEETPPHLLHDSSPSPEDHALASDTRRALGEAMDQLTFGQRQVVELRLAGLTGPEIANVLGLHITAVKSSQLRAYARLRELMHDHVNLTIPTNEETNHG
jgi:RNA polymerase sigma-70 factor (ECF subfamily)